MKKIATCLVLLILTSCSKKQKDKNEEKVVTSVKKEKSLDKIPDSLKTIFDVNYQEILDIKEFKNYEHNSSSVINYKDSQWEYAVIVLQKEESRLVVFEKIIETGLPRKKFQILDTLHLNNLSKYEFISVGLCDKNDIADSRVFARIKYKETDPDLEYYTEIEAAWKVNLQNKKIEKLSDLSGIKCVNEGYGI
ncbi:conserved hypothetical protein [Tenacibaculum sp. 190524A05c]|uniref:hypothetical protein n=1 Tax=Tenacibaculum platacis TaxID=3137852 RepID=UPI0031FB0499